MADDTTQRKVHEFLSERLRTLEPFTKQDIVDLTGWTEIKTYWSKQFKGITDEIAPGKFVVKERFWPLLEWKKFKAYVTQVKTTTSYKPTVFDTVVIYEFYLPLAHEAAMRATLDSLFYEDVLIPRLRRIGADALREHFAEGLFQDQDDEWVYEQALKLVDERFGGYSIYHVNGRFRAADLLTREESVASQQKGGRYLVDETTAVVRFIFPCEEDQADVVRFLFKKLFMDPVTDQVSGEDQIWVVESGSRRQVQVWKPQE